MRAPNADATTIESIIGVSTRPASVADDCSTTCTNNGRKELTANMTMPMPMPMIVAARNARRPNSVKSIIGSAVRRSWNTKLVSRIALIANEPTMTGDPQP